MKRLLSINVILMLIMITAAQTPDYHGIIYVTPTGAGTQLGDSWANATSSIAEAQTLAQTYDAVVWAAEGIYYGDTNSNIAFSMVNGVNVYGGFIGVEPSNYDLSLRDIETNATILDGQDTRVVLCQGGGFSISTIWDGFVIQNGRTSSPVKRGGGVYLNRNGVLNNCIIRNNTSFWCTDNSAGGVYLRQSTLSNCKILNNRSHDGGGVYALNATVINCEIYDNQGSYRGGGIYADESQVIGCQIHDNVVHYDGGGVAARNNSTVSKCDIYNNTCNQFGGGVYADNNSIIDMCDIFENTNNQSWNSFFGGGIHVDNSTIKSSHVHHNVATQAGGGGISTTNNAIVSGCIISHNASYSAGAGAAIHENCILVNCLISNNTVLGNYGGGGVYIDYGGSLNNSTIVRNAAQRDGAGFSSYNRSYTVTNCVIWGNESNGILDNVGTMNSYYPPTCSYSAIEGICDGEYNIDISGQQIFMNPSLTAGTGDSTENVDWHLLPDAACINQGNNAFVTEATDLEGFPRIGCSIVDMGCYEFYHINDIYQTVSENYMWHDSAYTENGDFFWVGSLSTNCDSIEILHLNIDPSVRINHYYIFRDENMKVYPNPTSNIVNVELSINNGPSNNVAIQVFDIYGKLLDVVNVGNTDAMNRVPTDHSVDSYDEANAHGMSAQTIQIDLSRYASGVYFIKAVSEGIVLAVQKVVKNR